VLHVVIDESFAADRLSLSSDSTKSEAMDTATLERQHDDDEAEEEHSLLTGNLTLSHTTHTHARSLR
jgi:hypothetical protein